MSSQTYSTSDSTLINGLGRSASSAGAVAELAVVNVTQGKRYRMRLVSISCDPNYTFSIDGHNMTVIEADGVNHEPVTVDSITIYAGQRYSFIVRCSLSTRTCDNNSQIPHNLTAERHPGD